MPPSPRCQVVRAGVVEYLKAWELQRNLARQVHEGSEPNTLLLLEHPAVYTIGRRGVRKDVRLDDDQLSRIGIPIHDVDRGGQVTYHGPGQLVAYPMIDLQGWGGPVKYVRTLEQVIIRTLADFGVEANLVEGLTGVWVGMGKIAAIGVKISRGVSYHGFAINVNVDLSPFQHIVPCGISDGAVTSMEEVLGRQVDIEAVAYSLAYHFGREMDLRMVEVESLPEIPASVKDGHPDFSKPRLMEGGIGR